MKGPVEISKVSIIVPVIIKLEYSRDINGERNRRRFLTLFSRQIHEYAVKLILESPCL